MPDVRTGAATMLRALGWFIWKSCTLSVKRIVKRSCVAQKPLAILRKSARVAVCYVLAFVCECVCICCGRRDWHAARERSTVEWIWHSDERHTEMMCRMGEASVGIASNTAFGVGGTYLQCGCGVQC